MKKDGKISSVKKAMDILKTISDADGFEISLSEISIKTGIPKPTCSHIIKTLCDGDYVERTDRRGYYNIGPMCYYVTRNGRYQQEFITACYPVMKWLNQQTGQTVVLSVLNRHGKYIVHYINGERPLKYRGNIYLGHVYETATGRALFSSLDDEERNDFIEKNGMPEKDQWPEAVTSQGMKKEVGMIRSQGYVTVIREKDDLLDIAIGAPIINKGTAEGAMGIAMRYVSRSDSIEDEIRGYVKDLLRGKKEIDHRLGFED